MSTLRRIWNRAKQITFLHKCWNRSKSIVEIFPFYLVQEGRFGDLDRNIKPNLDHYKIRLLNPVDMTTIAASPEVGDSLQILNKRLADGCLCFGLIDGGDNIAAYMWVNLHECDYEHLPFRLKEDEAYLFDAWTFKVNRGKNIAPFLRYEIYKRLEQMKRNKLYSITMFFNEPSINFKRKLKVKPLKLYLALILLKKYRYTILLKSY